MASNRRVPAEKSKLIVVDRIEPLILTIRGHKVLLDSDLAALYRAPTKRLNEQIRRHRDQFSEDFTIQLTGVEAIALRSQNATSNVGRGGRRYQPYAFTAHGAIMAATILNSPRAVEVSPFAASKRRQNLAWGVSPRTLARFSVVKPRRGDTGGHAMRVRPPCRSNVRQSEREGIGHGE